jgi:hypothetical protein
MSAAEKIAIVSVSVTGAYTVLTLLLWITTRRSVRLTSKMVEQLVRQVNHQLALSQTASKHGLIDSHRELFLSVLGNRDLTEILARENEVSTDQLQRNILASFLINHCSTIFDYHVNNVISSDHLESFVRDAKDMFQWGFLRERWKTVRTYHSGDFQQFVDTFLLSEGDFDPHAVLVSLRQQSKRLHSKHSRQK